MKNSKLRTILFSLILFASIGSYAYIDSVKVPDSIQKCEKHTYLDDAEDSSNAELPDVKLIKKLIEKGKEMIPATRF